MIISYNFVTKIKKSGSYRGNFVGKSCSINNEEMYISKYVKSRMEKFLNNIESFPLVSLRSFHSILTNFNFLRHVISRCMKQRRNVAKGSDPFLGVGGQIFAVSSWSEGVIQD